MGCSLVVQATVLKQMPLNSAAASGAPGVVPGELSITGHDRSLAGFFRRTVQTHRAPAAAIHRLVS